MRYALILAGFGCMLLAMLTVCASAVVTGTVPELVARILSGEIGVAVVLVFTGLAITIFGRD